MSRQKNTFFIFLKDRYFVMGGLADINVGVLCFAYKCISVLRDLYGLFKKFTLREKCPNTEFFLVRIFLYSDWIQRFTE